MYILKYLFCNVYAMCVCAVGPRVKSAALALALALEFQQLWGSGDMWTPAADHHVMCTTYSAEEGVRGL